MIKFKINIERNMILYHVKQKKEKNLERKKQKNQP